MNRDEKRALLDRYLSAYNAFGIDGMLAVVHRDIEFKNIAGGEVNAEASGIDEFRKLAEQSKTLFSSRRQTLKTFNADGDQAMIEVAYRGVLAVDLRNGMKQGQVMELAGRSEFRFSDGLMPDHRYQLNGSVNDHTNYGQIFFVSEIKKGP
jgi:ketosteroid isomerase-like protein